MISTDALRAALTDSGLNGGIERLWAARWESEAE